MRPRHPIGFGRWDLAPFRFLLGTSEQPNCIQSFRICHIATIDNVLAMDLVKHAAQTFVIVFCVTP
mgnify:CR=1 FL=1